MSERVDLHTHSTASDGTDSPTELVHNAHRAGLKALALTDHDTLSGLPEARKAASEYDDLEFVRGVEVSTGTSQGEMHIVGLWVPEDCQPLADALAAMRAKRTTRNERIVDMLQKQGVDITMDDVMARAGGESVGRPHIAMALRDKGYVTTISKAFDRYLGPTGSAYLPKEVMDPLKAVEIMSAVGCSVIIAHPMLKAYPPGWIEEFVKRLLPCGLCGIEAWHSEHTDEDTQSVLAIARRYELCVSGGSDYHGHNKPRISLGTGYGSLNVSAGALTQLKRWREAHHLPC